MQANVKCRQCGWTGWYQVRTRRSDQRPGQKQKRPAVTGVPCPGCGEHTLRRVKKVVVG